VPTTTTTTTSKITHTLLGSHEATHLGHDDDRIPHIQTLERAPPRQTDLAVAVVAVAVGQSDENEDDESVVAAVVAVADEPLAADGLVVAAPVALGALLATPPHGNWDKCVFV
jgi:hypothetical protein